MKRSSVALCLVLGVGCTDSAPKRLPAAESAGAAGSVAKPGGTGPVGSSGATGGGPGGAGSVGAAPRPDVDHSLPGVIVVLGSSTSAGTGPTDPAKAWVPRYKAYLAGQFPNFVLYNLAAGGQTTFHIQASDFSPPPNRPSPVLTKNISAALELAPDALIINMPSNDQGYNFPLAEQLANYDRLATLAAGHGALLWVTTSQPRNFSNPLQLTALMEARDAITQNFGAFTLNFWTAFAQADGRMKAEYNSGDGVHMNDAAHAVLATLVIAAEVPETVLRTAK